MKILILGDSWAADWSIKYSEYKGWPNLLADKFEVTNIAQAGVCQYSIVKQLNSIDSSKFDRVICSITSPYRLYTPEHPVHKTGLHANSDLIFTDLEYHRKEQPTNYRIQSALDFYEHHFDITQAEFVNQLIVDYILSQLDIDKTVVTSNIRHNQKFVKSYKYCNGYDIWKKYQGTVNHLTKEGNEYFAHIMEKNLETDATK